MTDVPPVDNQARAAGPPAEYKGAAYDFDQGRRASDVDIIPEDCDAAKAQTKYDPVLQRNNSLKRAMEDRKSRKANNANAGSDKAA